MSLGIACYYHPSPFGSGPPIWGCDMRSIPAPPQWLLLAFYPLAALTIVLGLLLIVMGRNPLPVGRRIVSPLAARLEGSGQVLIGLLLVSLANEALAHLRGTNPHESPYWIVWLFGPLLCAGLGLVGWWIDQRARRAHRLQN